VTEDFVTDYRLQLSWNKTKLCKNCSCECAFDCTQMHYTVQEVSACRITWQRYLTCTV